jgi:hypothetical protein
VASTRLSSTSIASVQAQISHFRKIGLAQRSARSSLPEWLTKVLEFDVNKVTSAVDIEVHVPSQAARLNPPSVYLGRNNYTVTIEKPSCATRNSITICVRNEVEEQKCRALKLAAMGRRILPTFKCILGEDSDDCIQKVKNGEADVVTLGAKEAHRAEKNYGLKVILAELESMGNGSSPEPFRYALGVIRSEKGKNYKSMRDLRGKRSCHGSVNSLSGWNAVLKTLRDTQEIAGNDCSLAVEMGKYFGGGSCVPGARDDAGLPQGLCSICAGDGTGG